MEYCHEEVKLKSHFIKRASPQVGWLELAGINTDVGWQEEDTTREAFDAPSRSCRAD